ncbi:MAG: ElyC/SanA/YdcF family protein [Microbacteriaceae bacterium]
MFVTARGRSPLYIALLTLLALFGALIPASVSHAETTYDLDTLKARAIYFQKNGYTTDLNRTVAEIAEQSTADGATWSSLVTAWDAANTSLTINETIPTDLPTSGHAFVVLGYALASDGSMQSIMLQRLQVALAAATAYPDSTILVAGGAEKNGYTEGEVMHDWLVEQGVDEDRILTETESSNTQQNAANSIDILYAQDDITSFTLISSSSHIRRATVLFTAASLDYANTNSVDYIEPVENAAVDTDSYAYYDAPSSSENSTICSNVASLFGVSSKYSALSSSAPTLSQLTSLEVTAPTTTSYVLGDSFDSTGLAVTAIYDDGDYSQDVTDDAVLTGFDSTTTGEQTITVSYTEPENNITATTTFTITVGSRYDLDTLKARAIYFQKNGYTTDLNRTVAEIAEQSTADGATWSSLVTAWDAANTSLTINETIPTDLPTSGHAFVVLGYALASDGSMQSIMLQRLQVALAAATAYPDSTILVAGGAEKNGYTEGEVMHDWLVEQGVDEDRILTETESSNTQQNAANSIDILYAQDDITSFTLISSSSHIRRATVLFTAASLDYANTNSVDYIEPVENAAVDTDSYAYYDAPSSSENSTICSNVASLFGVSSKYSALSSSAPTLSQLTSLEVTAPTTTSYVLGDSFDSTGLAVTAIYDDGDYSQDVTDDAVLTGFDSTTTGEQTITVSYTEPENNITATTTFTITVTDDSTGDTDTGDTGDTDTGDTGTGDTGTGDTGTGDTDTGDTDTSTTLSASSVTASVGSVRYGRTPSLTVTVTSSGTATPTGTVTVSVDGTAYATQALSAGAAAIALSNRLSVGTHAITVAYSGDSATASSTGTTTVKITKATTSTTVKLSASKAHVKSTRLKATIKVKVPSTTVHAKGKVRIYIDGKLVKTVAIKYYSSNGKITVTLPKFTSTGKHKVVAKFVTTTNLAASTSPTKKVKVKK